MTHPNLAALRETYRNCTVSSGTLRERDLVPSFLAVLKDLNPAEAIAVESEYLSTLQDLEEDGDADPDVLQWLMEHLYDALNDVAPEGTAFGSIEGDGACFGFWTYEQ